MQFTESNKNKLKINDGFILAAVIFFALFLRTYKLDNRPLHVDEAVHAVKFGELLEDGYYKYDPVEYHGPTLNYFTLISSSLAGIYAYEDLNEYTIRLVPAVTAVLFILLVAILFTEREKHLKLLIVTLLAISPIFVFYSRYYIQEVLLVSFTYSLIFVFYRYLQSKKIGLMIFAGVLAGLVFATKETSIIIFGTGIFSVLAIYMLDNDFRKKIVFSLSHVSVFLVSAVVVAILFYSSFFSNNAGIIDSLKAFTNYFTKAGGNQEHIHPWYYYLKLLLYTNNDKIFFSEVFLFLFAVIGIYFSFFKKSEGRNYSIFKFISLFSLLQLFIYSAIPYKTPWLALNFWIGFLILAAFGIFRSYFVFEHKGGQILFIAFVGMILFQNMWQTYDTNFKYPYQPENPFTYSQATPDVITLANIVTDIADTTPEGKTILIDVTAPNSDYWPLPWYLRKFKNVAWNNEVRNSIYNFPIIISVPEYEDQIIEKLYTIPPPGKKNLYVPLFDQYLELRPGVELRGYIQKDVLDIYNHSLTQ
ncbi:hypothetical protein MNBD_IGNAVI01-1745 [hydrothermal vent metagenome]|uniref:Glycosyltransferase RgtA/B/C/D-like domain-containing protein n=1 Tax=hydrothermal vent metagenome TaxID=652676 RepID=A0A3B1CGJ0_9ZZZZ